MQPAYHRKPGDRILRLSRIRPWRILLPIIPKQKTAGSSSLIILYGFAAFIALGTVFLILPWSTKPGVSTSFLDALFTATSAVCVTGLTVVDTADHWSLFGQCVILALIQLGGFGFMSMATLVLLMFGRRIGLREKLLIGESLGLEQFGGVIRFVWQIAIFTLVSEAIGAALLYSFTSFNSLDMPLWKSVFHSISAFNNAGFDLFGNFSSLSGYNADIPVLLITAALVFTGGISYLVFIDVLKTRRFSRLLLDSKLVLSTTGWLLGIGTIIFILTEYFDTQTLGTLPPYARFLNAFFQAVSCRTAGFSAIDIASLGDYALFFTMLLMFIGGASGSTAGGIKVNNFSMLIATIWSSIRGKEHPEAFNREFDVVQIHRAMAVAGLSLALVSVMVFLLTVTEKQGFINLLFEVISAFGTVGLSTGITPMLTSWGRLIIIIVMYIGRLGPLTLTLSLVQHQKTKAYRYPRETVRIG